MRLDPVRPLLLALVLAAGAAADTIELRLASGQTFRGEIQGVDDERVELRVSGSGSTVFLAVADLDPLSRQTAYRSFRERLGDGAGDRLRLARFCMRHELYLEAQSEYRAAIVADPARAPEAEAGLALAREKLADRMAERGLAHLDAGEFARALELFEKVIASYPDTPAAARIAPLVGAVRDRAAAERAAGPADPGPPPAGDRPRPSEFVRALEAAADRVEKAEAAFRQGVEAEGRSQPGAALKAFARSEELFEAGRAALGALTAAVARGRLDPGDEGPAALERLRNRRRAGAVELYLSFAHHYASTRQLHQARAYVNKALADHPENEEAKSLRQAITEEMLRSGR